MIDASHGSFDPQRWRELLAALIFVLMLVPGGIVDAQDNVTPTSDPDPAEPEETAAPSLDESPSEPDAGEEMIEEMPMSMGSNEETVDSEPSGPAAPPPNRAAEEAVAGTALGVGVAAAIAGLVTRLLAERAFDRAETAGAADRDGWLAQGSALEVSSIASWVGAAVLVIGGLTSIYLIQVEREAALEESYEARVSRRLFELAVGVSPTGASLEGRF